MSAVARTPLLAALVLAACGDAGQDPFTPGADLAPIAAKPASTDRVTIAGSVHDSAGSTISGVEVVALGPRGETTTTSRADGSFRLTVPRGTYRVFVRDDAYLSIATRQNPRIHGPPSSLTAGVPDEALLPTVSATANIDALDLFVVRAVTVAGRVVDRMAQPIGGAVVRAVCRQRPVLGTDVALSNDDGTYALRLPAGERCILDGTHERFAGLAGLNELVLQWSNVERDLTMTSGCVVSGKVIDANGEPAGDGAIERRDTATDFEFGPSGQIAPDGTFRWVTVENTSVSLRAWPWRSPPAPAQRFECRDGERFDNVVYQLPAMTADLDGVLRDRAGQPMPFAFVDLAPRSPGGIGQQERTNAEGQWRFYDVPPGPYVLRVHVAGHGMHTSSIMVPQSGTEELTLGGTARLTGTTTALVDGSFELTDLSCSDGSANRFPLDEPPRLVIVRGGAFAVDDLPACKLLARARWRQQEVVFETDLTAGGVTAIELELGVPRTKRVYGTVRDEEGRPVAQALVGTRSKAIADELTQTDDEGRYSITSSPGAHVHASLRTRSAERQVGAANVDEERIDLVLSGP